MPDPMAGGATPMDPMAGDPNAIPAEDPMTGADPNAAPAGDSNAGMSAGDPMAGGEGMEGGEAPAGDDDSTTSIIDQLSDDDKEAVRNYAKSLLKRDETQGAPEEGAPDMGAPAADSSQGVMMEISKGNLKKVQKALQEKFRDTDEREERSERRQKKVNRNRGKKSPFDSPLD